VQHGGGSTDIYIEIDPNAFSDPDPAQPDENSNHTRDDHVGQRGSPANDRRLQRSLS
jgi:hypothetical protein